MKYVNLYYSFSQIGSKELSKQLVLHSLAGLCNNIIIIMLDVFVSTISSGLVILDNLYDFGWYA